MYISNVGVNSSFHFAPKLAINYNVSLFNGNSSLKIRPLSELLPDEHRPKMLGYGVLPFSNQRKIADIGDMSSFKRIHTRPLQVVCIHALIIAL